MNTKKIEYVDNMDDNTKEHIKNEVRRHLSPIRNRNPEKEEKLFKFIFDHPEILESRNSEANFSQIRTFISNSKNDLRRANDAFKDNDPNNTVLHLQQSIEKIVKAYGMYLGIINDPQKEVGHNTSKVYIKLLGKSWITEISDGFDISVDIETRIKNIERISADKSAKAELDKSTKIFLKTFKKVFKSVNRKLSERGMKIVLHTVKKDVGIDLKRLYLTQTYFSYFLCPFAFITSIYAVDPRYEDRRKYKDLKLIKYFPEIKEELEKAISYIGQEVPRSS